MDDLIGGSLSLGAASELIAAEVRRDPDRTRFWPQHIETEIGRGRISAAAARTLFDAIENFGADKTMWLDPSGLAPAGGPAARAPAANRPSCKAELADVEQMRAALFGPSGVSEEPPVLAQQSDAASEAPSVGAAINGRYKLLEALGLGGVGRVYRALDLAHAGEGERRVTLKIVAVNLRQQPQALDALRVAVVKAQALDHPNIAAMYDIDRDGERAYIVMEELRGRWLSQLIREVRGRGLAYDYAWPIISGIALGLAHAHERGVLHHDLSPHSVFLCEGGTPKILGFGLLHAVPTSNESLDVLDTQTLRAYSEAYTADPWAQQSSAHPADDLYPLGVMAYEMLTGAHPFQRCSLTQARQKNLAYAPIPGLNARAARLIERCLSFEREVRPRDAGRFVRRMQAGLFNRMMLKTV
jgi:tRNA A-37 threonylcarbamoyl transferase component Bud32